MKYGLCEATNSLIKRLIIDLKNTFKGQDRIIKEQRAINYFLAYFRVVIFESLLKTPLVEDYLIATIADKLENVVTVELQIVLEIA